MRVYFYYPKDNFFSSIILLDGELLLGLPVFGGIGAEVVHGPRLGVHVVVRRVKPEIVALGECFGVGSLLLGLARHKLAAPFVGEDVIAIRIFAGARIDDLVEAGTRERLVATVTDRAAEIEAGPRAAPVQSMRAL